MTVGRERGSHGSDEPKTSAWERNPDLAAAYESRLLELAARYGVDPEQVVAESVRVALAANPLDGPEPLLLAVWGQEFSIARGVVLGRFAHNLSTVRSGVVPQSPPLTQELSDLLARLSARHRTSQELVLVHSVFCLDLIDRITERQGLIISVARQGFLIHAPNGVNPVDLSLRAVLSELGTHPSP